MVASLEEWKENSIVTDSEESARLNDGLRKP